MRDRVRPGRIRVRGRLPGTAGGHEVKRGGVDAVALARRSGAIVEDVTEVPAARAANDLGAAHEQAVVGPQLDRLGDGRLGGAGPPRSLLEARAGLGKRS